MTEQRSKGVQASEGEGGGEGGRRAEQARQGKGMADRQDQARREKGLEGGGGVERDSASNMMLSWVQG